MGDRSPPRSKSNDEIEKEREEAKQQLDQLLNATRPKNLGEGVASGVSNIVAGAVGAAGVAVLMPTLGLAAGIRGGGIVGGVLGVAVGSVAGLVGAGALAVGGAVSGVMQIGRGIAAVPQSVVAPHQGKWWNESLGKWVLTDMDKERMALEDVPESDSDILKKVQDDIDASGELGGAKSAPAKVVDMFYYDCLGVSSDADPSLIKRRYYVLARQCHPDKVGPDDKEAAEKFKDIAEAYQVLSDPKLRAKYDKCGREGLSADKTTTVMGGMAGLDPVLLFAFLFGSDRFYKYTGRLATATSASVGDTQKISLDQARTLQKRRVTRMAIHLIEKITPWVDVKKAGDDNSVLLEIQSHWLNEAVELTHTSFGYQMVTTIGKIYSLVATIYDGSVDSGQGLPGLSRWAAKNKASMDKRKHKAENQIHGLKAQMELMKIREELQQRMDQATTAEDRASIASEMGEVTTAALVQILWTTAVVDITSAIQEATQMVFFDRSVDKATRRLRAKAVECLGDIWMNVIDPHVNKSTGDQEKTAKMLYEEAAFAAMVETMKHKDEETHRASSFRAS